WDMLRGEGEENWIREEERDAEQYQSLLRYADRSATIPPEDLTVLEGWWSRRKPNRFWARRYTRHSADTFEKIREVLVQSRARADAAIEEQKRQADTAIEQQKRFESRVIAIVAHTIRHPKLYHGAADSLSTALDNKRPDLPNVTDYVNVIYDGLSELR